MIHFFFVFFLKRGEGVKNGALGFFLIMGKWGYMFENNQFVFLKRCLFQVAKARIYFFLVRQIANSKQTQIYSPVIVSRINPTQSNAPLHFSQEVSSNSHQKSSTSSLLPFLSFPLLSISTP